VTTLVLFGCGGGGDSGGGGSIAKAEFVKQANSLCVKTQKEMQKNFEAALKELTSSKSEGSPQVLVEKVVEKSVVPGFEAEISGIEALGSPSGDEAQVEATLDKMQGVIDEAQSEPKKFLRSAAKSYEASQKAATEAGIPACGTPNKPPEEASSAPPVESQGKAPRAEGSGSSSKEGSGKQ